MITVDSGWAARPHQGLTSCGDAAIVAKGEKRLLFAVVDALGHGPDAMKSAQKAKDVLLAHADKSLREAFVACDRALVGMRGAVLSAVQIDGESVLFAGIGNVDLLGPPDSKRPACVAGILGRGMRSFKEYALEISPGDRWVLVSDGVRARDVSRVLRDCRALPPKAAADTVLEKASRLDDDATALVMDFGVRS